MSEKSENADTSASDGTSTSPSGEFDPKATEHPTGAHQAAENEANDPPS